MPDVTVADIATNLGQPAPLDDSPTAKQWLAWAALAERIITRGLKRRGIDPAKVDPDDIATVIVEAVTLRAQNPNAASQVSVSIDDGSVSRTYEKSTGQITILPEWWDLLTPAPEDAPPVACSSVYSVPLALPYTQDAP